MLFKTYAGKNTPCTNTSKPNTYCAHCLKHMTHELAWREMLKDSLVAAKCVYFHVKHVLKKKRLINFE